MEDRHLGDLPRKSRAVNGDYLKAISLIGGLRSLSSIQGTCWLSVGTRRRQAPSVVHPGSKWCGKQNSTNRCSPAIPRGVRWHIQNGVFFQECHKTVNIICLPGTYIAGEERARLCIRNTLKRPLSFISVVVLLKGHPSTVQCAVHR